MAEDADPALVVVAAVAATRSERPLLRAGLMVLCGWELTALATRRLPTVSAGMWHMSPPLRAAVFGLALGGLTDHFFTRRWT